MSEDADLAIAGERGTRRFVPTRLMLNAPFLRRLAVAKTDDFRLLTAEFGGDRRTFEPWLSIRLADRERVVSYGVYQPAFPRDDSDVGVPDVVWRRAEWDELRDARQFDAAEDKSAYLLGDSQIESHIRFGVLAEQPRLAAALREGVDLLTAGVPVVAMRREDVAWENLRVRVSADELVMNLDYAPWLARCGEVESWAERWSTLFDSLDDTGTVAPDGDVTVSYDDSFGELVARIRRFPRPVFPTYQPGPPEGVVEVST